MDRITFIKNTRDTVADICRAEIEYPGVVTYGDVKRIQRKVDKFFDDILKFRTSASKFERI